MAGTLTETRNLLFNNAIWDSQLRSQTPSSGSPAEISSAELQSLRLGTTDKPKRELSFRKLLSKEFRIDPAPVITTKAPAYPQPVDPIIPAANSEDVSGTVLLKVPQLHDQSGVASASQLQGTDSVAVHPSDRRRSPRRVGASTVSFCRVRDISGLPPREVDRLLSESKQVGRLLDISLEGMACLTQSSFAEGDEVVFRLTNPKTGSSVDTTARVLRCHDVGRHYHTLHMQLITPLSAEHVQDLSEPNFSSEASLDPSTQPLVPAMVEAEPLI